MKLKVKERTCKKKNRDNENNELGNKEENKANK